jgi:predicted alpha/beta superfamily hydrolase
MKIMLALFILIVLSCHSQSGKNNIEKSVLSINVTSQTTKEDFNSIKTGDTYELIIKRPNDFDSTKAYHHVYFTDAGINSGSVILNQPGESIKNCILIGIAHKGDWDTKRKRDFIPSDVSGDSSSDFGHASKFYSFVKEELIPYINKKFPNPKSKVFIGHSFGGLLALYMSMKENKLFDHYYAISPSVWANYYELMKIEKDYSSKNKNYNSNISIYAGSLEFLNKVLSSSKEFYDKVSERKYNGLNISRRVVSGVNHYGIVPKVIPEIFGRIKVL